ncbi:hypothetical protein [Euzebya sp.]|uniref:hypothetical protein n=1 Tax=Euzebya sp. TaxID=1971409 RepID=UPI0035196A67
MRRLRHRLIAIVLRTPLHPTMSRRFMLLTALGDVPVDPPTTLRYATHDGAHIVLGAPDATWWRGLSADAPTPATVRFAGRSTAMTAVLARGEALDEAVLRYLQKYPGEWTELGVDAAAGPDDVREAAHGAAVVVFTPVS